MAGPVKGTIGQEEVVLNDAATETTLLKLLAEMQKQNKSGGGGGGAGSSEAQQRLMELAQQTGKTEKQLEDFEEQVEETGNILSRGFGHVFQGLQNIGLEFMSGSTRLSDFSSHITGVVSQFPVLGGVIGGTFQLLTSVLDNAIDTFRDLSGAGVDFGGGLMETRLMASRAGISMDAFSQTVTQNSENLALFGGSATAGARAFARISGEVQKSQSTFSRLGLTMEETAEFTADYMAMQTRLGRAQRMSDAQMATGATNLIMEIDKLAKVTGQQREEVAKQLQENMQDTRIKMLFSTMDEAAQANLNGVLTMMQGASPKLKDAMTEMVATGGVPMSAFGKDLLRLNPDLGAMAKGLQDGTVSQEQFMAEVRKTATAANNLSDEQKKQMGLLAAMGSEVGSAAIEMQGLQEAGKALTEVEQQQKDAADNRNRELLDFESKIQKLKNTIMDALINSGIFDMVQDSISALVSFFSSDKGTEGIKKSIQPMIDWFNGLVTKLTTAENPMDVIKSYLKDGLANVGSLIGDLLKSSLASVFGFGGGSDEEADKPKTDDGSGDSGTGWFSSITDAIGSFGSMIATGTAVYIAVKGFQKLLAGFAAPQVALGTAVLTGLLIGTGAAIMLAGEGISAAGDGVNKIADGLARMGQIEGAENIKDLGSALGDMGTAMLSLGAGNVLDSITSFFGASSPFEKMVAGINEFTGVDPVALASMTSSAGALGSLKSFADDIDSTKVEDFAESITKLATAMEKLNDEYADTRGFFGGGGPGSQEILQAISSGTSQGSAGVNSSIGELVALMKENNRISKQILAATGDGVY